MAPCTRRSVKRVRDCDLQLLIWQQSHSERLGLAARDLHLLPVELSHDEAVEALVVGAAVDAQEPERLLLADEEAAHAVGAAVHAGGVAAERDVGGELVDLVAEGDQRRTRAPAPRRPPWPRPHAAVAPAVVAVKSAGPRRLVKSGHFPKAAQITLRAPVLKLCRSEAASTPSWRAADVLNTAVWRNTFY